MDKMYNVNIYNKSLYEITKIIEDSINKNLKSIGFYLYTNNSLYNLPNEDEELFITNFNLYVIFLNKIKQKYNNINIYIGLETNYEKEKNSLLKELKEKVDYFILSDRYLPNVNEDIYPIVYANYIKNSLDSGLFDMIKFPDKYIEKLINLKKENSNTLIANQVIIDTISDNDVSVIYDKRDYSLSQKYNEDFWTLVKNYNISILTDNYALIKNIGSNNIKTLCYETLLFRTFLNDVSKLDFNKEIIFEYINSEYNNCNEKKYNYFKNNVLSKEIKNVCLRRKNLFSILYQIVSVSFDLGCSNHKELNNICTQISEYNFCKDIETKEKIINSISNFTISKEKSFNNIEKEVSLPLINNEKLYILSLKPKNGFINIFAIIMILFAVCSISITIIYILFLIK